MIDTNNNNNNNNNNSNNNNNNNNNSNNNNNNKRNNNENKTCFHICLEGKNETVALYPTFLAQEIPWNNVKIMINTITKMQDKTVNVTQDS